MAIFDWEWGRNSAPREGQKIPWCLMWCFNYFLANGDFCHLLITFANNLDADEDDKMSVLIWIQTVCHADSVPERIFGKVDFEKKKQSAVEIIFI